MIHKGAGATVNMSSGADITGITQNPIYDTSKHAVIGLTKSATLGYESGIRINALAPGLVKTDTIASDDTAADSKEIANAVVSLLSGTKDTWYLMGE